MMYLSKVVKKGEEFSVSGRQGFYTQQVTYDNAVDDCVMAFPFGYHANLTDQSLVVTMGVRSDAGNRIGFGWTPLIRPDLKQGEVAIYAPDNPTHIIKLRREPGIEDTQIIAPGTVLQFCNRIQGSSGEADFTTVTTFKINAGGDITLTPGGGNKVIIEGSVQVNGDINATGTITGDTDVIADSISGKTHLHVGSPTAGTGAQSNTGLPL